MKKTFFLALDSAIRMEYDKRIIENQIPYHYSYDSKDDDHDTPITIEDGSGQQMIKKLKEWCHFKRADKEYHVFQSALLKTHPVDVSAVDSLWQTLLIQQGIDVETGVIYTTYPAGDRYYSRRDDHAFYDSNRALETQTLGMSKEMSLQGFVKITPRQVFRQSFVHFALLIFICLCSAVFLLVWFLRKKTSSVQKSTPAITWDKRSHILHYENGELLLTNDQAKLFDLLWDNQERCTTYEELTHPLYGEKVNNSKDNLTHAVKRLRAKLAPVSGMNIETHPGVGYRLSILYISKG
ncbi:MAG: helix-turn-helix domain-containing protein [Prevotella sp.]|nr:helix-turn-helix domain-containing protein [Prevotella sp.]